MKMSEKTTNDQRKPEKLLPKTTLKMTRKSGSLETNIKKWMVAQYCALYVTKATNVKHCCYVALTFDHPQTGSSSVQATGCYWKCAAIRRACFVVEKRSWRWESTLKTYNVLARWFGHLRHFFLQLFSRSTRRHSWQEERCWTHHKASQSDCSYAGDVIVLKVWRLACTYSTSCCIFRNERWKKRKGAFVTRVWCLSEQNNL